MKHSTLLTTFSFAFGVVLIGTLTAPPAASAQERSAADYFQKLLKRADNLFEKDQLLEASPLYRKILFASPKHSKARKRLKEINQRLCKSLVDEAAEIKETNAKESLAWLERAAVINPQDKVVKAAFKKRGFKFFEGKWRTKDNIDQGNAIAVGVR